MGTHMRKILIPSAVVVLATLIVVSIWYFTRGGDGNHNQHGTVNQPASKQEKFVVGEVKTRAKFDYGDPKTKENENFDPFTPEYTILNLDCQMLTGDGTASDVALVTHPTEEGVVFAVIGESGELARGELDFRPNHLRIGRRDDGSVIYGFGDLRSHAKAWRPEDVAEPVRIYHDDFVIYESAKVLDFDVADDGASFAVHEPSAGGVTRLVVRNLNEGSQVEHELDTKLTREGRYSLGYSLDGSEVVFSPAHAFGRGSYWFFNGSKRRIGTEGFQSVLITSSENGYFVERAYELDTDESEEMWEVSKRRFIPSTGQSEELWSVRLSIREFNRRMSVSENGKWLGLRASDYKVLDTETGETIFDFPYRRQPEAQLARLAPILPKNATVADLGEYWSMSFKENYLVGYRVWGDISSCDWKPGEKYDPKKERECILDLRLRGLYKHFHDIYDMNTVDLNGSPMYTTEVHPESYCMPASSRWKGLISVDGKLAFQPVPPIENIDKP